MTDDVVTVSVIAVGQARQVGGVWHGCAVQRGSNWI